MTVIKQSPTENPVDVKFSPHDAAVDQSAFEGVVGALLRVDPSGVAGKHRKVQTDIMPNDSDT